MSYYHSYRPQQFRDLLGQDHVRAVLLEALKQDRLSHAYLFCGTRGTGKTSTARLLAKAINCIAPNRKDNEPCNACEVCVAIAKGSCLDVIEIDAASNRGIDEIRQLQEQSRFQPQGVKRKIFIIDEVHMLTKEAFNALLKTLEEPPAHLLFILATTEPHKLPATIISRCQRFDFRTPDQIVVSTYLKRMAEAEKLKYEPLALDEVAVLAKGSFRDAATILEQLASSARGKTITPDLVQETFGLPDATLVDRFLKVIDGSNDSELLSTLQTYFEQGKSPVAFLDMAYQRYTALLQELQRPAVVFGALVRAKSQMRLSPVSYLPVIVALVSRDEISVPLPQGVAMTTPALQPKPNTVTSVTSSQSSSMAQPTEPIHQTAPTPTTQQEKSATGEVSEKSEAVGVPVVAETTVVVTTPPVIEAPEKSAETVTISVAEQVPPITPPPGEVSEKWQTALTQLLEDSQSSLVSILRTAQPLSWDPPALRIGVQFKFHADQLTKQKNRDILEAAFAKVFGSPVRIDPEVVKMPDLAAAAEEMF